MPTNEHLIALLRTLEWSGKEEVYAENDDESICVSACPFCGGLQALPEAIGIGDKYGHGELPVHPDYADHVGHRQLCELERVLR